MGACCGPRHRSTLVLSLMALLTFTSAIGQHTYAAVNAVISATLLAYAGALVAVGTCASALVRAWRNKQADWFVALVVTAVLPLLATLAVFEYTQEVLGYLSLDLPMYAVGEQLAAELLIIGPAALLVYGLRLSVAAEQSPAAGAS
jgi:hypothetical protein